MAVGGCGWLWVAVGVDVGGWVALGGWVNNENITLKVQWALFLLICVCFI